MLNEAVLYTVNRCTSFQFYPLPVFASYEEDSYEWKFEFEESEVEALIGRSEHKNCQVTLKIDFLSNVMSRNIDIGFK